ncbi:MAG: sigma-54 dependent transcriptional regulator, partial [Myxococcota bacterium]
MTISNSSRPPSEPPLSAPLPRLSRAGGDDPDGAPNYRILALDDDERLLNAIRRLLRTRGLNVEPCTDPQRALAMVEAEPYRYDLMMLDVNLGRTDITGLGVLHQIRQLAPDLPVVMLTADASAQTAVAALKAGAFHYLVKPLEDRDVVELTLRKAGRVGQLHKKVREFERRVSIEDRFPRLIGASAAMRRVFTDIENAAQTDMNVLILGESGTGKELVAREIHEHSSRGERQIVPLNCGAIQESLIDGELFGHLKGAFTGASSDKRGVFSEANGGTLFLDEIGELPLNVQPRLLRVLQEGEVRPVGSTRPRKVDVRVIAATNIDLEDAAARGEFRQDLYYRLNVITIHLPPLRQRMDDLPL